MPSHLPGPRPEVVFLDVGDTMVRAHPSWAHVYRRVLADFGVEADEAELRAALDATFGDAGDHPDGRFEASAEASYRRLKEFDTRVLAALGWPAQPDAFYRALEAAFHQRSSWWVFEDVPTALEALREAGYRLGVISNWSWTAPELLHTLELARHFEAMIISDRVGYLKPHRGIFEHALSLMGVSAGAAVHVGDSVRADVHGAQAAGMRAVLIDRRSHVHGGAPALSAAVDGAPAIEDLLGLLDLLGVARPSRAAAS